MSILEVSGLRKVYTSRLGGSRVEALRNVSFTVEQGEYVAIMGESGSGKTTLLNILAALDEPTAGTVRLDGHELGKIREKDAAAFRRDNLGFVFQEFNLLDTFTLEDNIYLPLVLMGMSYEDMRARLLPVARELGLTRRKAADRETALEITEAFRNIFPDDPVKADFVLTRFGIHPDFGRDPLEKC